MVKPDPISHLSVQEKKMFFLERIITALTTYHRIREPLLEKESSFRHRKKPFKYHFIGYLPYNRMAILYKDTIRVVKVKGTDSRGLENEPFVIFYRASTQKWGTVIEGDLVDLALSLVGEEKPSWFKYLIRG